MKLKYYLRGLGLGIVVTAIIMGIIASGNRKMTDEEIIARAKQLGMIESTVLTEGADRKDDVGQETDNEQPGDNGNEPDTRTDDEHSESGSAKPQTPENTTEPDAQTDANAAKPNTQSSTNANTAEPNTQSSTNANTAEPNTQTSANVTVPDTKTNSGSSVNGDRTQAGASETDAAKPGTQADAGGAGADTSPGVSVFPKVLIIKSGEGSYTVSKKLAEIGAIESAEDFDTYLCENGYDKKIRAGTYTIPLDADIAQMAKIVTGAKITE